MVAAHAENEPGDEPDLDPWWIDIAQNGRSVALALPKMDANNAEARALAAEISQTLFDDISFASELRIVDPTRYPLAGKTHPLDHHSWESIGADRAGSPQIYSIDAEGLNLRRISTTGSYNARSHSTDKTPRPAGDPYRPTELESFQIDTLGSQQRLWG